MTQHLNELVSRTLMMNPDGGETNFEHVMFFFALALQLRAKKILELGVRQGGSTYPFLLASKFLGGKLVSIDKATPIFRCPKELEEHWHFINDDTIVFLKSNKELYYDLIYIDDWHSEPHVTRELEIIEKIATPETIILLHDTMPNCVPNYGLTNSAPIGSEWEGGGPFAALQKLDKDKWEYMTIPKNHGLTLLRKKGEIIIK